ncbi:MAG TPA: hypothetical protein VIR38_07730 [Thalassobaculum sp.]
MTTSTGPAEAPPPSLAMLQDGSGAPNEQWRQGTPDAAPSEKG